MLGEKFDEALMLASALHREQFKKKTSISYLSHLMAVAGIVLEANEYCKFNNIEDIAIGALLHDAIEDQGHKISLEEIRMRFGDIVYDIVLGCTDAVIEKEGQEKPPWRVRKEAYISNIRNETCEIILVSSADKLHNARAIVFDYNKIGDDIWKRFKPSKEETLWYYKSLCETFEHAWPENPLLPELKAMVDRIDKAVSGKRPA